MGSRSGMPWCCFPSVSPRFLAAAFEWCWRAVALVTPLVLSLPISPSNGSPQMLPSRAGKNRYRVGSGSPCRWRRRTESIASQQFRAAGRSRGKQLHQLSAGRSHAREVRRREASRTWAIRSPGIAPRRGSRRSLNKPRHARPSPRKKEPAEHGRNLRIAAGGRQSRVDRALARLVYTRGRESAKMGVSGAAGSTERGCWGRV